MGRLCTVTTCEDDLQKKNAAKLLKENDEFQNLRAELQKKYSNFLGFGGQIFNFLAFERTLTFIIISIISHLSFQSVMWLIAWNIQIFSRRFGF